MNMATFLIIDESKVDLIMLYPDSSVYFGFNQMTMNLDQHMMSSNHY